MKLYQSPTSPYARKVRACIRELGLQDRVEEVLQSPRENTGGYYDKNPLARIPTLETDDGMVLFDSPVICEYLDALGGNRMFPAAGPMRWTALKLQALGDGIMDAAVPVRAETLRPAGQQSPEFIERTRANMLRTVGMLNGEAKAGRLGSQSDIGTLAVACALGYLDFRFADMEWRSANPDLAAWFAAFVERPSMAGTPPA